MTVIITAGKFPTGRIVMTPGAMAELTRNEAAEGLLRHVSGDWGDLNKHEWRVNEAALEHGLCLFSSYVTSSGTRFYIITEYDRSVTTVLLPEEY